MSALLPPPDLLTFAGSLAMHSSNGPKHISSNTKSYRNNPRGGMVGEVEGYLWMQRQAADATREEAAAAAAAAAAVGGAMRKRKWCVLCPLTYFVRQS